MINIDSIGVIALSQSDEERVNGGGWDEAGGWAGFGLAVLTAVGVGASVVAFVAPEPTSTYAGALGISAGGHALAFYGMQLME